MTAHPEALSGTIDVPVQAPEEQHWAPKHPEMYSRSQVRRQTGDYASFVTTPIVGWIPHVANEDAADLEDASIALIEFDRHALHNLGSDSPALGPMSAILLRTESASSSQIEQLTTTAKQLALAEIDEGAKKNALSVIGNVRAMEAALRLSENIDVSTILAMHRELLRGDRLQSRDAGRFRDEAVWIGGDDAGPIGAEYIAPHHNRVRNAVDDLVQFMQRVDMTSLLQVAVAHAQFETIHPFADGNGRTGRALAQALLRNKGLAAHTTVPISTGLLVDTESYFSALNAYRAGDAGPIVRRFAAAARFAAVTGRRLVDALSAQLEESREKLTGLRPQSAAWQVLPRLIGQPIVNAKYLQTTLGLNAVTATRALDALTDRGVLVERTGWARNRVWQHTGVLDVLDEYAAGIRRAG
ncbi:Fic family protein [Microbacterium sp.]|uniref:Fic family protein n=1 Tax=Microbacterium sp. TaxID=51671 RepID=UPI003F9B121E